MGVRDEAAELLKWCDETIKECNSRMAAQLSRDEVIKQLKEYRDELLGFIPPHLLQAAIDYLEDEYDYEPDMSDYFVR